VELSPETCRVKPLRRINAIVVSCWNYFTISMMHGTTNIECTNVWQSIKLACPVYRTGLYPFIGTCPWFRGL